MMRRTIKRSFGVVLAVSILMSLNLSAQGLNLDSIKIATESERLDNLLQLHALKVLQDKAKQGDAEAQYKLGKSYVDGGEKATNPVEGAQLLEKAAEQGHAAAQLLLAHCYSDGIGVERASETARRWLRQSAEQGYAPAQYDMLLIVKTTEEKMDWLRRSAEGGHAPAQAEMAIICREGDAVPKNLEEAVSWYRRAAEQGYAPAQYELGLLLIEGEGELKADPEESWKWFRAGAAQGHTLCQVCLGTILHQGMGRAKDPVMAYVLISLAADANEAEYGQYRDELGTALDPAGMAAANALKKEMSDPEQFLKALDRSRGE